jgi:hypothetical protein
MFRQHAAREILNLAESNSFKPACAFQSKAEAANA